MKCPNCGEELPSDDFVACPKCAVPLSGGSGTGNALAIAAFSCAIAGPVFFWVPVLDAVLALLAVGLGIFANTRKPPITGTAKAFSWMAVGFGGVYFLISIFTGLVCI